MLERLEAAYVRSATHQADKRKQPKAPHLGFMGMLFSVTQLLNELCISGKVQVCWCELQKLSCLQAEMDVKGIKLKDELYICFLPLNHFVQVFWSLKKALFPHSNMYWYIDSALSPHCALPGSDPEPEAPKGLYSHPGIYKSVGDWLCSSAAGRKTAGSAASCFQQFMQHKEQAPQLWPVNDFPVNSTQHLMDFAHL